MFRNRMTWLAATVTTSLLALLILSVGTLDAKTPGWGFSPSTIVGNPSPVSPGAYASYSFDVTNTGKSNISAVYLTTDIPVASGLATPAWVFPAEWSGQDGPTAPCGTAPFSGPLNCDLGNIVAGGSVHLQIVFQVPSTAQTWNFNFMLTGNGNTPSDSGGTSHGDTKYGPASVQVSDSVEFAGGFVLDTGTMFTTTDALSRTNPQFSSAQAAQPYYAVTLDESNAYPGSGSDPCSSRSMSCIGQWLTLRAPNPSGNPIKVVMTILGKGIPGSVGPEDITLWHDGTIIGDAASERCTSATDSADADCIFVTEVGGNFQIVAWLTHNGSLHGAY